MNYDTIISQLWPNWKATPGQATEYRDRLSHKNPAWVESAIRDHYSLDCPKDGVFIEPRLSKILQRYAAIAEAGEAERSATTQGVARYRASWVESRRGQPYAMASAQTFPTKTQALEYAEARGSKPDAIPVGDPELDFDEDEVMRDDRVMRNALCQMPADRLEAACVKALGLPLGLDKESVAGHPIEWKRFVVGVVHSVAEAMSARR